MRIYALGLMLLIGTGVLIGHANLQKIFGARWFPSE